ncbi:MAG: hypothetical protein MUO53_16555 [Maribacter sp.]|nr:hypothetical protein [Maribacter sp.]
MPTFKVTICFDMNIRTSIFFLVLLIGIDPIAIAQDFILPNETTKIPVLFQNERPISIKLAYDARAIKNTTDSTYVASILYYKNDAPSFDSMAIRLQARGIYRRKQCFYTPLKMRFKKSLTKGTIFEGTKKLKVVLPCSKGTYNNDDVVKEYMGYKLYEIVSPIHFKTRLANIELIQDTGRKTNHEALKGFFIEDLDAVAARVDGKELKRNFHPLQQDGLSSVRNAIFEYLIGNTDFSMTSQHNYKLVFVDKKVIGIPYDFDMSGLVDASYAAVSGVENMPDQITEVTERLYKGYQWDVALYQEVRQEYLDHKTEMLETVDRLQEYFEHEDQFIQARRFIVEFFEILESDTNFNSKILNRARE